MSKEIIAKLVLAALKSPNLVYGLQVQTRVTDDELHNAIEDMGLLSVDDELAQFVEERRKIR